MPHIYFERPLVCMPIELYKREIDTRLFLAALAVNKGYDVLIGFHRDKIFKSAQNAAFFYKGHGLGNRTIREEWKAHNNFVTALDEEGLIRGGGDLEYSQERLDTRGYDHLFAWGDDQASLMSQAGISNFTISGSPKFDVTRLLKRKVIAQTSKKIQVCINTRFGKVNPYTGDGANPLDELQVCGSQVSYNPSDYDLKELRIFREFIQLIQKFKNNTNICVIIRPHPAENKKLYEKLVKDANNIVVDNDSPLFKTIFDSDVVVHDACTTALEAKSAGKIVFTLRPGGLGTHYVDLTNKFSDHVYESAQDLWDYITDNTPDDIANCSREPDSHINRFIANWKGEYFFESFFHTIHGRSQKSTVRYDVTKRLEAHFPSSRRFHGSTSNYARERSNQFENTKLTKTDAYRKDFIKYRAKKKFPTAVSAHEIYSRLILLEKLLDMNFDCEDVEVRKITRKSVLISRKGFSKLKY